MAEGISFAADFRPAMAALERVRGIHGGAGRKAALRLLRQEIMAGRRAVVAHAKAVMTGLPRTAGTERRGMARDPRDAYKAVKTSMYRTVLGGSISILSKRRAGMTRSAYEPPRLLRQGQRGGNRMARRSARAARMNGYYGADRGFVLRFFNSGTKVRHNHIGARGSVGGSGWFAGLAEGVARDVMERFAADIESLAGELFEN